MWPLGLLLINRPLRKNVHFFFNHYYHLWTFQLFSNSKGLSLAMRWCSINDNISHSRMYLLCGFYIFKVAAEH
jgi:hypothetical protein